MSGYKWTRAPKATGLAAVCVNNRKREWQLYLRDERVGLISNPTHHWSGADKPDEWIVTATLRDPFERFTLNRRFKDDEIPEAKKALRALYEQQIAARATRKTP